MKIISEGKIPGTDPIQATCNNCRTIFEFHPMEAKFHRDQRDGDCYSIDCPICRNTVYKNIGGSAWPYD